MKQFWEIDDEDPEKRGESVENGQVITVRKNWEQNWKPPIPNYLSGKETLPCQVTYQWLAED